MEAPAADKAPRPAAAPESYQAPAARTGSTMAAAAPTTPPPTTSPPPPRPAQKNARISSPAIARCEPPAAPLPLWHRNRRWTRGIRPWHPLVLFVAMALVVVLPIALVHARNDRRRELATGANTLQVNNNPESALADLGYAQYQGTALANGVNQYLGMRYAAAPLGDLRWRAPAPPDKQLVGPQPATRFGNICLGIGAKLPNDVQGEDCLFANVWAPRNATVDSKLPVWLFIQGGGYTINSNANWNGSYVVERAGLDMVFVNFNYRVGAWGFLASERLRADGNLNAGLLDQRMMMQWVQKYIAQFGGDPNHVVIHGASAGAGSVALHLAANRGINLDLFVGAIAESVFLPAQPPVAELEWQFDRFVALAGCPQAPGPGQMTCLRNTDAARLQAANTASPFPGRTEAPLPLFYWTPCIDGDLLTALPYDAYATGSFIKVPVIFGTGTNEGTYFASNAATPQDVANFFQNNFPHLTPDDTAAIVAAYPQPAYAPVPHHEAWFPAAAAAYGEATFICPNLNILAMFQQFAPAVPVWGYRYDVVDDSNVGLGVGVPHLWESWAIVGPDAINGPGRGPASYYTYNANVVPVVMDYWISFVKALSPNAAKNPAAPIWDPWLAAAARGRLLFRTNASAMETTPPDLLQRCGLWKKLAPVTEQKKKERRAE